MADETKPDTDVSPMEAQNTHQAHETPPGREGRQSEKGAAAKAAEQRNRVPEGGEPDVRDDL